MTANQVAYWKNEIQRGANAEIQRANLVDEAERQRHNTRTEELKQLEVLTKLSSDVAKTVGKSVESLLK